jgi:hypothetical protein
MNLEIKSIEFINEVNDSENDNVDISVNLSNGDSYAFTVFTLKNIACLMEKENESFFYCPDILIVKTITEENIKKGIEHIIKSGCLDSVGIKQE